MANSDSRLGDGNLQGVLLDDPEFLREIVERVIQEFLEAEMETHIGAAPYERNKERSGRRNPRSFSELVDGFSKYKD